MYVRSVQFRDAGFHHLKGKLSAFISAVVDFIVSSPGGMTNIQTVFDIYPLGFGTCLSVTVTTVPCMWADSCHFCLGTEGSSFGDLGGQAIGDVLLILPDII